ncbi:hypothetical protein Tco_1389616 [Tanacetum coccineum]
MYLGEVSTFLFLEFEDVLRCIRSGGRCVSLNFIDSIKEARSRVQDLTSGEIVSLNLLSQTRKLGHSTMELREVNREPTEIFNIEHRVNESKYVELVKQKKRSLALERNKAIHTQVEELTKANISLEVKYQTWVSNPIIAKKADGRWKLCIDFTDINKTCPKENHPLPATESKVEDIHKHRFKCFLDAYKGYHQILIAEKDEERRLSTQEKGCQVGQNMQVNADEMVIKGDSKEEMLADIKETLKRL